LTLTAYRLTKEKYANTAFDGEGARLNGGRWNPAGVAMVYLADTLPLAVLETLVHLERSRVLEAYVYFEVTFDDELVLTLGDDDLPEDWQANPEPASTLAIGKAWVAHQASLFLRVPSAVIPLSHNFLLNPAHPASNRLKPKGPFPFTLDARLV
jgi:RES domain-containing protein